MTCCREGKLSTKRKINLQSCSSVQCIICLENCGSSYRGKEEAWHVNKIQCCALLLIRSFVRRGGQLLYYTFLWKMSNALCVCVCVGGNVCERVWVCVSVRVCLNCGFSISIPNQKSIRSIHFQSVKLNRQETQIVDDGEILLLHYK